jgi:hypothetical protein
MYLGEEAKGLSGRREMRLFDGEIADGLLVLKKKMFKSACSGRFFCFICPERRFSISIYSYTKSYIDTSPAETVGFLGR